MNHTPRKISRDFILENYDVVLLDAFGVLMDIQGALPGAVEFIDDLNASEKPYFIVSNSTLYNAEQNQANYLRRGLKIPSEKILTSGVLLPKWLQAQGYAGQRFVVLGPELTKDLVRSGGVIVTDDNADDVDGIILGHQSGFDFVSGIDHAITLVFRSLEKGKQLPVILPNPDLIYPQDHDRYGITAGSLGLLLTEAVKLRFPEVDFQILSLGKPFTPLFEEARARVPVGSRMIMVGDQLHTDIQGARDACIDSVLIGTGITKLATAHYSSGLVPTYVMDNFLSVPTSEMNSL